MKIQSKPGYLIFYWMAGLVLLALIGLGQSDALGATEPGAKAEFQAAYGRYQQAIEDKDAEAAAAAAGEALDLGSGILSDDSPSMAALYVNYGMALVGARRFEDAVGPLRAGIKRLEKLNGKTHESLIDPLWALAEAYRSERGTKSDEEVAQLSRILGIIEITRGADNFLFAEINLLIGKTLALSGARRDQKRARTYLTAAYDTYQSLFKGPAYQTGISAFWLGKLAMGRRKYEAAEEYFLDALGLFEETSPPGHQLPLMTHSFLIALYEERGKSELADAHCQAISLLRPLAGVDGYKPLYKKIPRYPRNAARNGDEGYVLVEFTVTTRGTVENVQVVESDGVRDFKAAALMAVRGFRYAPAVKDGKLVETEGVRNLISFVMAN